MLLMDIVKLFIELIKIIPNKFMRYVFSVKDRKHDICSYIINELYISGSVANISFYDACDYLKIDNVNDAKLQFRMVPLSRELCNYICNVKSDISIDEKRKLYKLIQEEKINIDKLVDMPPYSVTERYFYRNSKNITMLMAVMMLTYVLGTADKNIPLWISVLGALVFIVGGAIFFTVVVDMLFLNDSSINSETKVLIRFFNFLYNKINIFKRFFDYYGK